MASCNCTKNSRHRRVAALLRRGRQHCGQRHNICMSNEACVLNIHIQVSLLLNLPGRVISTQYYTYWKLLTEVKRTYAATFVAILPHYQRSLLVITYEWGFLNLRVFLYKSLIYTVCLLPMLSLLNDTYPEHKLLKKVQV